MHAPECGVPAGRATAQVRIATHDTAPFEARALLSAVTGGFAATARRSHRTVPAAGFAHGTPPRGPGAPMARREADGTAAVNRVSVPGEYGPPWPDRGPARPARGEAL
ncbi:hypothetical protein AAW14_20545 [Streptomyces hygroscopicus]|nr:hypothetical protein [Streptomyces hygroscopicus]